MGLDSKVKFNHEVAEEATKRRGYTHGQHFVAVTGVEKQLSKGKPETGGAKYKMLVISLKPLRDPNDLTSAVGRGLRRYMCLPFWDEEWDNLDEEIQKKLRRNMGIFAKGVRETLSSLLPEECPSQPTKNADGTWVYAGEEIDGAEYRDRDKDSVAAAGDVAERLWNDGPEELNEKGCYITIGPDPKGKSDFDQILQMSATPILDRDTGEELPLVPADQIEGFEASSDEGEEGEDEAPAPVKRNGAAGKPTASARTVAQAAANKKAVMKKGAAKGARR